MRSKARECAFKIIYASLFQPDEPLQRGVYKTFDLSQEERDYADRLLEHVVAHRAELEEELGQLAIGFSKDRLFPVDKSLLLMAMAEIRFIEDVPPVVSVDEAVGLAKKYSTEKSVGFVNGILASYIGGKGEQV